MPASQFAVLAEAIAQADAARTGTEGGLVEILQDLSPEALAELIPACAEIFEATST